MGSNEEIAVGDDIIWWRGPDGRGIDPDDPSAKRCGGRVAEVHRHPAEDRVVAYSVLTIGSLGEFVMTARPEHHPTRVDAAGKSAE